MFSQKLQILIISSLLLSVLVNVSSALGADEPTSSARTRPKAYLDPIVENNLVRQSCLPLDGTDTLDCNFYFDAKKHSPLDDPSNCLEDQSWLSACFKVYYADTFSLNRRSTSTIAPKALVDNLKIGSFQALSAEFTDVAVFLAETDGYTGLVGFADI